MPPPIPPLTPPYLYCAYYCRPGGFIRFCPIAEFWGKFPLPYDPKTFPFVF